MVDDPNIHFFCKDECFDCPSKLIPIDGDSCDAITISPTEKWRLYLPINLR